MPQTLTLQAIAPVTHDTWHLTFARPDGFDFQPGQASELTLPFDGIRDEGRPFTMVSQPSDTALEFVIKSYPEHDGVTEHVPELSVGDQVGCDGPFGAITDHGTGCFIAAGAGVTPFISILKKHEREGVAGDTLIFSNSTDRDIILKDTWESMSGVTPVFVVTDQEDTEHRKGRLDKAALGELIEEKDQPFYICGPQEFVDDMRDALKEIGVDEERIVTEEGW